MLFSFSFGEKSITYLSTRYVIDVILRVILGAHLFYRHKESLGTYSQNLHQQMKI